MNCIVQIESCLFVQIHRQMQRNRPRCTAQSDVYFLVGLFSVV